MYLGELNRSIVRFSRTVIVAVVAAGCLVACSPGDIEFQGKLFELAGVNNIGKKGPAKELAPRTGLVVPPDLNKLPDPNQPASVNHAEAALDLIQDPDRVKQQSKEDLARQQAEACKDYELAKMRGDESSAINMEGPLGPCRKSVLTSVGNWMKSN